VRLEFEGCAYVLFLNSVSMGGVSMIEHSELSSRIIYSVSALIAMMLDMLLIPGFALMHILKAVCLHITNLSSLY
jgi:hypothetical protein